MNTKTRNITQKIYADHFLSSLIGKRDKNEDRHTVYKNINGTIKDKKNIDLYCVYDGHGGDKISNELSVVVPYMLTHEKISYPLKKTIALKLFEKIQKHMIKKYPKEVVVSGSTCLCVIKFNNGIDNFLNILNVGDSRAVMCSEIKGKIIQTELSYDHKPIEPQERIRIENMGGKITYDGEYRIGSLSVSRSFGDTDTKYTAPIPDVFLKKLNINDKFIIIACDGLWDVVSTSAAINFVLFNCYENGIRCDKYKNIAKLLAEYAIAQGSMDNISVIVVFM